MLFSKMSNLIKVSSERRMRKWLKKTTEQNLFRVSEFRGASVELSRVMSSRAGGMEWESQLLVDSWQFIQKNKTTKTKAIVLSISHCDMQEMGISPPFSSTSFHSLILESCWENGWVVDEMQDERWEYSGEAISE